MSEPMTPERAREMLEAATPGPWTQWVEHGDVYAGRITVNEPRALASPEPDGALHVASCWSDDEQSVADAALIAAAPDLARAYLAEHERAERAEAEAARLADELAGEVLAYQASETAQTHQRERAERAERDLARLREVADAARELASWDWLWLLREDCEHSDDVRADAKRLDAALARLDGGGR